MYNRGLQKRLHNYADVIETNFYTYQEKNKCLIDKNIAKKEKNHD